MPHLRNICGVADRCRLEINRVCLLFRYGGCLSGYWVARLCKLLHILPVNVRAKPRKWTKSVVIKQKLAIEIGTKGAYFIGDQLRGGT